MTASRSVIFRFANFEVREREFSVVKAGELLAVDPKAVSEGHDPQLEKAVSLALEELGKEPAKTVERPSYPNYHQ
jgi:hypothetical protein